MCHSCIAQPSVALVLAGLAGLYPGPSWLHCDPLTTVALRWHLARHSGSHMRVSMGTAGDDGFKPPDDFFVFMSHSVVPINIALYFIPFFYFRVKTNANVSNQCLSFFTLPVTILILWLHWFILTHSDNKSCVLNFSGHCFLFSNLGEIWI